MQGEGGYVKSYRSLIDWEWFTDVNTAHLWTYILLRVNYEPSRFRGIEIKRGEMLESIGTIAKRTGLSVKSVRTALKHLESTGEVACQRARYGMRISVLKYTLYQDAPTETGTQNGTPLVYEVAKSGQLSGNEVATYKESKEYKEVKKERRERGTSAPTLEEVKEFIQEEKLTIDPVRFFSFYEGQDWKTASGYPIRDWKAKARSWQSTEKPKRDDVMPEYWNADPIRDSDPQLATQEEIERVRAMLLKGKGERFR